jgi:hypothetical protein
MKKLLMTLVISIAVAGILLISACDRVEFYRSGQMPVAETGGYGAETGGYGAETGGYGAETGGYGAETGGYGSR